MKTSHRSSASSVRVNDYEISDYSYLDEQRFKAYTALVLKHMIALGGNPTYADIRRAMGDDFDRELQQDSFDALQGDGKIYMVRDVSPIRWAVRNAVAKGKRSKFNGSNWEGAE